ncbi:hypothetical protein ACFWY9_23805 [Amycolatopsis sp. NPDC059027]|uniref:hypothetical protein n=1 Tax=Amycolatopsis sp. NPDC059027 TaxID=3346709 RepID=UPI003670236C
MISLVMGLTGAVLGTPVAGGAPADGGLPKISLTITGGTSTIKKLDSSVEIGAGKLSGQIVKVDPAKDRADFTADITLPPAAGSFKIFGVIPTTATVEFSQAGPITGILHGGKITAHADVTLKLKDVKAVGFPLLVGDNCTTSKPASIDLVSAPDYDIFKGGYVSGIFAIPEFTGCGLSTIMLNLLIPGPDNGIKLHLGPWVPSAG